MDAYQQARGRRALQEANRLLVALRSMADELPGGLDVTTVAVALGAELRQLPGTRAALVYTVRDGALQPAASTDRIRASAPTLRIDLLRSATRHGRARLRTLASLPRELQTACGSHRWWAVAGMHRGDDLVGVLLVGVDEPDAARFARPRLIAIAEGRRDGAPQRAAVQWHAGAHGPGSAHLPRRRSP